MLTSDQLDVLQNPILDLYERFHTSIIEDIARRLVGLDYLSAAWQAQRLIEAGLLYEEVIQRLSELTGQSETVLKQIFEQAGVMGMQFDDVIYRAAGLDPVPLNLSPQMVEVLRIGLEKTKGLLRNLTMTTATSAYESFLDATDLAYMQISTGALDYNTAIREAVKEVAGKGLQVIYFESGHRDKVDVATRRAVLTGVNQTVGGMTLKRADEMGTDLIETSAHIGARNKGDVPENHEMWQGRVFTRGTDPENTEYPNFFEVTGYGTITGLCGINCRHSFSPFFKGLSEKFYSQEMLDELANRTVTYDGKEMSWYDATQHQRKIEREIRQAKREAAAIEAAGLDASEEKQLVRNLQAEMRDFIDQTGLRRQYPREQVILSDNESISGNEIIVEKKTIFDLQSNNTDVVDKNPIDLSDRYENPELQAKEISFEKKEKSHVVLSHHEDHEWLMNNQDLILKAINDPKFVDIEPRMIKRFGYNIAHIIETGDVNLPYLSVVLNFRNRKAKIWTMFRAGERYLYYDDGDLKARWLIVK